MTKWKAQNDRINAKNDGVGVQNDRADDWKDRVDAWNDSTYYLSVTLRRSRRVSSFKQRWGFFADAQNDKMEGSEGQNKC